MTRAGSRERLRRVEELGLAAKPYARFSTAFGFVGMASLAEDGLGSAMSESCAQ